MQNVDYIYKDDNIDYAHYFTPNPQKNNYYKHAHNTYELLLFLRGDANYLIEGKVMDLSPGNLIMIRPTEYHMLDIKSSAPYERMVLNFNSSISARNSILPKRKCLKPKNKSKMV